MQCKNEIFGLEEEKRLMFFQSAEVQPRQEESPPEIQREKDKKEPESDKEVIEKAEATAGGVSRKLNESQGEFFMRIGEQRKQMKDSVRAKLTGDKDDPEHPIRKGMEAYEARLTDAKQGGLNVENVREHQRFMHESEKYIGANEKEWGFPASGKVDDAGHPFMYKRAEKTDKDGKKTPVLLATSPAAGFQVMDLKTGKWSYADPSEFEPNPQDLSKIHTNLVETEGKKEGGKNKFEQMTRNREMERAVLRNESFTDVNDKKQFDPNADYWQGEENAAIRDRIALLQKKSPDAAIEAAKKAMERSGLAANTESPKQPNEENVPEKKAENAVNIPNITEIQKSITSFLTSTKTQINQKIIAWRTNIEITENDINAEKRSILLQKIFNRQTIKDMERTLKRQQEELKKAEENLAKVETAQKIIDVISQTISPENISKYIEVCKTQLQEMRSSIKEVKTAKNFNDVINRINTFIPEKISPTS